MAESWFQFNFANTKAAVGGVQLPEGCYKMKITSAEATVSPEKQRPQVEFKLEVVEPAEFSGAVRTEWISIPESAEDKVLGFWRAALESVGYSASDLDGENAIGPDIFVDRVAHVYYQPGDKDKNVRQRLQMLPPTDWAERKRTLGGGGSNGSALGTGSGNGADAGAAAGGLAGKLGGKLGGGGGGGGLGGGLAGKLGGKLGK